MSSSLSRARPDERADNARLDAVHLPLLAANDQGASAAAEWLGLTLVSLTAAAMACFFSSDGDLGFHLATGRALLATGNIPPRNVLSFAEPLHAWGLHQWLPALGFELLYRSFGIAGVIGAKMAVVALIWAVVYRSARQLGAGPVSSALACLIGACASAFRFEARPYLTTHLTLALILLACTRYAAGARASRACVAAAVVAAVGCQLHAGALDGLIALGLCALGCALEPLRARTLGVFALQPAGVRSAVPLAFAAVGGGLAGALLLGAYHPLGARVLLFPLQMGSDAYLTEHLIELRWAWSLPFQSLAAYWLMLALWSALTLWRVRIIHAAWLLLGLAFAVLSLRFVRMAFVFSIAAVPTLALALEHTRLGARLRGSFRLAATLLAALALASPLYAWRGRTPGFGFEPTTWPLRHFDFIRSHALRGNVFVSDAWGGPFLGYFYPERRVFFDNRIEAYSAGFIREVYQRIRYGQPGWDQLLDRYAIEVLLLRYTSAGELRFQANQADRTGLRQRLVRDPRYTLLRFDDVGELFVRTHGANAALAEQLALRGVDPDRRVFLGAPSAAASGLLRALERGERSTTLLGLAALALDARGDAGLARGLAREAARIDPEDAWARRVALQLKAAE